MWVRLDDALTGHPKVFIAGAALGPQGTGRVLAVCVEALCWTNKYRTKGFLPRAVVEAFQHDRHPIEVAAALVTARLWEPCADGDGWQIHDYPEYQPDAATLPDIAQARSAAGRRGAAARWQPDGKPDGKHGKPMANVNGKPMANAMANAWQTDAPVPDPDPQDQDLSRAGEQPLPPVVRVTTKGKYQPSTKGAWSCAHIPPCRSTIKCRDKTLAEVKAEG